MMYGTPTPAQPVRATAVNERMHINSRVRLPGGDVDMETSMPFAMRTDTQRSPRSARYQPNPVQKPAKETEPKKQNNSFSGLSLRTVILSTSVLALALGMILLFDLSAMMEKSKAVNTIGTSAKAVQAQIDQLSVDLAMATKETDVAYNATQRLGLIAGKGAQTVYIMVPAKYQTNQLSFSMDAPPVQNGAYAALSGIMD